MSFRLAHKSVKHRELNMFLSLFSPQNPTEMIVRGIKKKKRHNQLRTKIIIKKKIQLERGQQNSGRRKAGGYGNMADQRR